VNGVGRALEKAQVDLKQAEEARSRLAAIVETSGDAIIGKTLDGTIVTWNAGAENIYGYSSQEIIGQSISLLTPPAQSHSLPSILERLRNGEHIEHFETRRVRKDGKEIDVSLTLSPLTDTRGNVIGASSIAHDITERKRAEDDLRRQKEMLQKIIDHIPVMTRFLGVDGRIELVNREWERAFGWTLEELQTQNQDILVKTFPDPEQRREVLKFVGESNREWRDFKPRARNGQVIDTTWAVVHLPDGTRIGIGQDITERKRAEEELRASREQLRALARYLQTVREEERTRIARELHDEIGQALTAIKFSLETSVRETADRAAPGLVQALELTHELIGRVRDMSLELRPAMLDDLGLLAALRWHFDRYTTQ
jgi:PAS domain S-box-containing protein